MPRPRGAIPTPRHRLAAATPFVPVLPLHALPDVFATVPSRLSYWLNNQVGDCVTAEEAASKVAFSVWGKQAAPTLWIDDQEVGAWARAHGVLNGANLPPVMGWMATDGMIAADGLIYRDGGYAAVDYAVDATVRAAIFQGPVKIGLAADQLENVVGSSNGWILSGAYQDGNEDHCTALWGYGTLGQLAQLLGVQAPSGANVSEPSYLMFTWSTVGIVTQSSLIAITGEAWLRTPTTVRLTPTPTPAPTPPVPVPTPAPTPPPQPPTPVPTPPAPAGWSGSFPAGRTSPFGVAETVTVRNGLIESVQ